jgi:hypothetical protein
MWCNVPLVSQAVQYGLNEEAFEIYKKFNKKVEAIKVRSGLTEAVRLR